MAIADALAAQVRHLDADVVQVDEANIPGSPDEWKWAAAAMNRVLDAVKTKPAVHLCFGNYGGQTIQKGSMGQADRLSQRAQRRPHRDGDGAPAARGACGVLDLRPEIGFGLGVIDVKTTVIELADAIARDIERAEKLLGRGSRPLCPSRLRFLDAQARHRRRQDACFGQGP